MYSFHRMHHTITPGWPSYLAAVRKMRNAIKANGVISAVKTVVATEGYSTSR